MTNLLHDAYKWIDEYNIQSAQDILEQLVNVDPLNIEAWEAYMQICETCDELDSLCERILQVPGIIEINRESLFDYYYFLRKKFKSCDLKIEPQRNVTFELMDQFNFSSTEQSLVSCKLGSSDAFQQRYIDLLGKVMILPYVILLLAGISLLFAGNNFGYWVLVVLTLDIFISMQKVDLPFTDAKQKQSACQVIFSGKRSDEIRYHSELIP